VAMFQPKIMNAQKNLHALLWNNTYIYIEFFLHTYRGVCALWNIQKFLGTHSFCPEHCHNRNIP